MKLYGKNPVIERLRTNPQSIRKIYIQEGFKDAVHIRKKAKQHSVPVFSMHPSKMLKVARTKNTQGVMADVEDFGYVLFEDILDLAVKKKRTIVFLDGITDPQNFGAMLRSLACLGRFAVVIPTHDSVSMTETVLRIASGGENYVPIAQVANLNKALKKAKDAGVWIAGSVIKGGQDLEEVEFPSPVGLVIGSEDKGIRDVIRKNLDLELTISMAAETVTFNAAIAATVLCYEITRQKKIKRKENIARAAGG